MSDDRDLGGEPACWAHMLDDLTSDPNIGDLANAADDGDGSVWSLPHGGDLDANIVRLQPGHSIARHVNDEVDVLFTVWSGDGELDANELTTPLRGGAVVHVERGAARSIRAGAGGLVYLTVHRRRTGLTIRPR